MEIKNTDNWQVKTPNGWSNFDGIKKTNRNKIIKFELSTNNTIKCTTNHKLKLYKGNFKSAENIKIGEILYNNIIVKNKDIINKKTNVYDLINVKKNNEYFTENVVSHNCGVGNWFHSTYTAAKEGRNNFVPMKLPWQLHPDRDDDWKENRLKNISKKEFAQEHGCNFQASGDTFLSSEKIQKLDENTKKPKKKGGPDNKLWIWEEPKPNKNYLISADTADEGPGDYSAFHVIDLKESKQVADFKAQLRSKQYGEFLVDVAIEYNNAILVIERNNLGPAVIQPALDRNYENLFWSKRNSLNFVDPVNNPDVLEENKDKASFKPGFYTTRKTRPLMTQKLEDYVVDDSINLNSTRTISELYTFIWKNGKPQAMSGYHDDLVISLCIGLFIRDTAIKLKNLNKEKDNKRMSWISGHQGKKGNKPNKIGSQSKLVYTNNPNNNDPYKYNDQGMEVDLRQLLN